MHATLCSAAWVGPKLYSDWAGCWVGWLQNLLVHFHPIEDPKPEENSCKNCETSSLSQTLFCVSTCLRLLNGF